MNKNKSNSIVELHSIVTYNFGFVNNKPENSSNDLIWMRHVTEAYSSSGLEKLVDICVKTQDLRLEVDSENCDMTQFLNAALSLLTETNKTVLKFLKFSSDVLGLEKALEKEIHKILTSVLDDMDYIISTVEMYNSVINSKKKNEFITGDELLNELYG